MNVKTYLNQVDGVAHTTLDPKTPGVVRIHLVPPKKLKKGIPWVVILNGYSVLPLQTSWAILLREFIFCLNQTDGQALSEQDIQHLIKQTLERVQQIFPKTPNSLLLSDLKDIVYTFRDIAFGKEPSLEIGYMQLSDYAKYMKAPHRMDLMISAMEKEGRWHCNQKCLHCYAANEKMGKTTEISTKNWKSIIDTCQKAGIPSLTFTGGEPTLRDDLVELVGYASWFVTRLNTNGILLTRSLCDALYEASLDSVQITLYSDSPDIHNKLVGGNHFEHTIAGIQNALAAGLDVSINTPLCSLNQDYEKTLAFAKQLGIRYVSCSGLIPSGYAMQSHGNIRALSKEEITNCIRKAWQYASQNDMEIAFTSPGWIDPEVLTKMKMVVPSCGACLSNMAIAPDGTVIPCQSWLFEEGLGNLLTTSWSSIWKHSHCKKIRQQSRQALNYCLLKQGRNAR